GAVHGGRRNAAEADAPVAGREGRRVRPGERRDGVRPSEEIKQPETEAEMLDDWQDRFSGCEPLAHEMRVALRPRWVRFHSLPESKRYPEDEVEYESVLHRHNCILGELLVAERGVVLLTTGY